MCDCVTRMNELLSSKNCLIVTSIGIGKANSPLARVCLRTEKINGNKKGAMPTVVATYCPFCGEKPDAD